MASATGGIQGEGFTSAIARLHAALDDLAEAEIDLTEVHAALEAARAVEGVARRVQAVQLDVAAGMDDAKVHRSDGHRTIAQGLVAGVRISEAESARRAKSVRALRQLPAVAAALRAGRIGRCQVDRIAMTWANPRVQEQFEAKDAEVAHLAAHVSYHELHRKLTAWEAAQDEQGTADRSQANHAKRDAQVAQEFDGGWQGRYRCGSIDGAQLEAIQAAFIDAEFAADWAEAVAIHGSLTTVAHLARTDAQRRFDALRRIHQLAADAHAASPGGAPIDTNIVIDEETFERYLRRMAGHEPAPRDVPLDPDPDGGHRCETLEGRPVDPTEAVANALVGHVRRAVLDARSVIIDLGRRQRLFSGPAALAARLPHVHCYWPACRVPNRRCQTDHLDGWRSGGSTSPENGAPECGHHNRWKEHGFTVQRDERGRLHVHRPDGTRMDDDEAIPPVLARAS
jgi:hypothetical protein